MQERATPTGRRRSLPSQWPPSPLPGRDAGGDPFGRIVTDGEQRTSRPARSRLSEVTLRMDERTADHGTIVHMLTSRLRPDGRPGPEDPADPTPSNARRPLNRAGEGPSSGRAAGGRRRAGQMLYSGAAHTTTSGWR